VYPPCARAGACGDAGSFLVSQRRLPPAPTEQNTREFVAPISRSLMTSPEGSQGNPYNAASPRR
jgi:hypothetical protein